MHNVSSAAAAMEKKFVIIDVESLQQCGELSRKKKEKKFSLSGAVCIFPIRSHEVQEEKMHMQKRFWHLIELRKTGNLNRYWVSHKLLSLSRLSNEKQLSGAIESNLEIS